MAMNKDALGTIRVILKEWLSKSCEIRTYEIWYQTKRQGVELDYKTVGNALRYIMDEQVALGNVVKIKLGCWRVTNPSEPIPLEPVHPSNRIAKALRGKEVTTKCESVRAASKGKDEWAILNACEEFGVTLQTYLAYLKSLKHALSR